MRWNMMMMMVKVGVRIMKLFMVLRVLFVLPPVMREKRPSWGKKTLTLLMSLLLRVLTNSVTKTVQGQPPVSSTAMPSARMNKEDYILELQGLGEEVPSMWTIPELKVRIQEIKEEQGMTLQSSGKRNTPFRVLAIEMNKCSKKRADLQEFTRTRLQMHVTGNETIAQLQKACLRKIYEITPPTPHDPTGFGVHSALSYEELFMTEPGYVKWVLQTASEGQADYRLLRLAKWLESRQVEPTKEVKKALNAKAQGARKQTAAAASVASDSSSKSNEALIQMIQSLQEEVAALREERPRKKTEKPDEQMTEGSFRVLSP